MAKGFSVRYFHPRKFVKRRIWRELIFGWSAISGQNLYRTAAVREAKGFADDFISCEDRQLWFSPLTGTRLRYEFRNAVFQRAD